MFTLHRTNVGVCPMKGFRMRSKLSILLEDLLVMLGCIIVFILWLGN